MPTAMDTALTKRQMMDVQKRKREEVERGGDGKQSKDPESVPSTRRDGEDKFGWWVVVHTKRQEDMQISNTPEHFEGSKTKRRSED